MTEPENCADTTWHADGHMVRLVVSELALRLEIKCPHDHAAVTASAQASWPPCWRSFTAIPGIGAHSECGVIAMCLEFKDGELWADGVADFEITTAPFAIEWFEDPDDGIVIRPVNGAVTPLTPLPKACA